MSSKYKLRLKDFKFVYIKEYIFPIFSFFKPKKRISTTVDLKNFIKKKAAWISQETLYGYLKTRMGTKYVLMFEDEVFLSSIDKAKWNVYSVSVQDLILYCVSLLKNKYNYDLTSNAYEMFEEILNEEKENKMPEDVIEHSKKNFSTRINDVRWDNYFENSPFEKSGLALYEWAPIADELKKLDKKIVINSINLKWENIKKEFLTLINF
tara:strand:+ start:47 stop:673 length:627 start_codon:yes stop_codon:yes gene_type:complete